jgi:tellurite resistance protein TehA-like permease
MGEILVKTALILQAVIFTAYIAILAVWHIRVKRAGLLKRNLRTVVWVLYTSSTLITARCSYRIVEYFQGYTGEVYMHKVYFYVFDAVAMLLNSVLLNTYHPGRYFPRSNKLYLAMDGVTEVRGPGWRD